MNDELSNNPSAAPPPIPDQVCQKSIFLKILRGQADKKGLLGGHKGVNFSITATAQITPEMMQLVAHYKLGEQIVATWKADDIDFEENLSVNGLLAGFTVVSESISKLQRVEHQLIEGCEQLKTYLEVARSFGSEEIIEI